MRPTKYRTTGQSTHAAIVGKLFNNPQTRRKLLDSMRHRPDAVTTLDKMIGDGIVVQVGYGTKASPYSLRLMPIEISTKVL